MQKGEFLLFPLWKDHGGDDWSEDGSDEKKVKPGWEVGEYYERK